MTARTSENRIFNHPQGHIREDRARFNFFRIIGNLGVTLLNLEERKKGALKKVLRQGQAASDLERKYRFK